MIRSFGSPFCSRPRRVKEDPHLFCPANCFLKQKVFFLLIAPELISLIFVVLACHQTELDAFDQHFQATIHFPLTSTID